MGGSRIMLLVLAASAFAMLVACGGGGPVPAPAANPIGAPAAQAPANEKPAAAPTKKVDEPDGAVDYAARQFAIKLVSPNLKAPSTAKFPEETIGFSRLPSIEDSTGRMERWTVTGAVDSQNGFGAMLRSHWRMTVGRINGNFIAVEAWLEGQEIFKLPGYDNAIQADRERVVQARHDKARAAKDAKVAARKEAADARPDEDKAQSLLKSAKLMLSANKKAAHRRLDELIEKFPETDAAKEAAELLKK